MYKYIYISEKHFNFKHTAHYLNVDSYYYDLQAMLLWIINDGQSFHSTVAMVLCMLHTKSCAYNRLIIIDNLQHAVLY